MKIHIIIAEFNQILEQQMTFLKHKVPNQKHKFKFSVLVYKKVSVSNWEQCKLLNIKQQ